MQGYPGDDPIPIPDGTTLVPGASRERIEAAGDVAHPMRANVRDECDLERPMETAARVGDGIDYAVAIAGIARTTCRIAGTNKYQPSVHVVAGSEPDTRTDEVAA